MADNIHESQQPSLIALCTIMLLIGVSSIALRFWSNHVSRNHVFGYDDLFALLALPCVIVEAALIFWWIHLGLGLHQDVVPPKDLMMGPKIIFIATFFYNSAITLPKFSVLFFYHRVFGRTSRWFKWGLWILGGMNASWLLAATLTTIFQCNPVRGAYDPAVAAEAKCFDTWVWFLATAIPSMGIDFLILILPLPLLWGLRATWKRRILVTGIFVCGYCVIVVSIGRLISLAKAGSHLLDDLTWTTIPYIMWVQCEGPISIMSVSLPNIVALVKHYLNKGFKDEVTTASHGLSTSGKSVDSRKFIRLEQYPSKLGNDIHVSSQGGATTPFTGIRDVNVTHEVDVTEHRRQDMV